MKRTRLRKMSKKRERELKEYKLRKAEYFELLAATQGREGSPPLCEICEQNIAVDWHHKHQRGAGGKFLADDADMMAVCRQDHAWIHANPSKARENGWLI